VILQGRASAEEAGTERGTAAVGDRIPGGFAFDSDVRKKEEGGSRSLTRRWTVRAVFGEQP